MKHGTAQVAGVGGRDKQQAASRSIVVVLVVVVVVQNFSTLSPHHILDLNK